MYYMFPVVLSVRQGTQSIWSDHIDCVTIFCSTKSTTCILIYMYNMFHVGIGPCNFWKFLNPGLHDMLVPQSIEVNLRWAAFNRHIVVMYISNLEFLFCQ